MSGRTGIQVKVTLMFTAALNAVAAMNHRIDQKYIWVRPFAATWMDLESIILSEINRTEEKYHMTSLICGL